jgi:hypothetical protein
MIQEIKGILASRTQRACPDAKKRGYEKANAPAAAPSAPSATKGIDAKEKKEK